MGLKEKTVLRKGIPIAREIAGESLRIAKEIPRVTYKEASRAGRHAKPIMLLIVIALAIFLFASVIRASLFAKNISEEKHVLFEITFLLFVAILAEMLVLYLSQPTVMVLLLVGMLISPSFVSSAWPYIAALPLPISLPAEAPHLVPVEGVVQVFAQLGAIILLFRVGLHSEIQQIFNLRNFIVGFFGVVIPFIAGFLYANLSGQSLASSMFLGAALTATSVGVTVAVLKEFRVLEESFAKLILGAAVIDDILALLVLSLVRDFPAAFTVDALAPFANVLATAGIFVGGGILVGQYVVRIYFDRIREEELSTKNFLAVLVFLLFYAYVAEFIGLSAIVGAFIAGVTLNYSKILERLHHPLQPLEVFFTPIFFISLGMLVDVKAVVGFAIPIISISILAMFGKILGCGIAAKGVGAGWRESALVGVGMVPRGEVALIVGLIGLNTGVLTSVEYSIIAGMAFLTTILVPPLLKRMIKS